MGVSKTQWDRYEPVFKGLAIRTAMGCAALLASVEASSLYLGETRIGGLVVLSLIAWLPAIQLTHKYIHKYPQRYYPYVTASHFKAAFCMAFFLSFFGWVARVPGSSVPALTLSFGLFILLDALLSVPRKKLPPKTQAAVAQGPAPAAAGATAPAAAPSAPMAGDLKTFDVHVILNSAGKALGADYVDFLHAQLASRKCSNVSADVIEDLPADCKANSGPRAGLIVGKISVNQVRRLNQYMLHCASALPEDGYLAIRYTPLENELKKLRQRCPGPLFNVAFILHSVRYRALPKIPWLDRIYFSWFRWLDSMLFSLRGGRNRVLSKAEVWGRLAYCGLNVLSESKGDGEVFVVAQKVSAPVQNRRPSYYPVVALEKVGLDGEILRTHKVRTMFPFSEFLQKRIFEDNGLASTGKFANDFRLTEFGKFLRKYWLDELPQIFDWLRGEVKLVGMRATSRHFLSLYPQELYDLYVEIKPGLIPPIFDETTGGFEGIVKTELEYLRRYSVAPMRTDVQCFMRTFADIVFRGVRSK